LNWKRNISAFVLLACSFIAHAQEMLVPINYNPFVQKQPAKVAAKTTTALSLPFFEDFTGYDVFPDPLKWMDHSVYINNTMGVNPISRGVATFDALNAQGAPYDSFNNATLLYADSLTSQSIDLSSNTPGDSVYLSFFYQPQGNGFYPEPDDSLMLYFKKTSGAWQKVWGQEGSTLQQFTQVMVPVLDTGFFHGAFQFRFVNKASIGINDDVWNVDYIRLDANRSATDTAINDIATTIDPTNLLNDYTAMPYRQFTANMSGELAAQHSFYAENRYGNSHSVDYGYSAIEKTSNTGIFTSSVSNATVAAYTGQQFQFPTYNISYSAPSNYSKVILENKYFASEPGSTDPKDNDTIIHDQVFDNYLAYDDGTAEKSYFLKQFSTLPAKLAIEFHLNQPDTLRGVAIYFGRQSPMAFNKFFSIAVYNNITIGSYFDTTIVQPQELNFPGYVDTVNHFWIYKLDTPVALNPGVFFLGVIQPAMSGSDSLYYGWDVNRIGGNHLYINATGTWASSAMAGAAMIRPLMGQPVIATNIGTPLKPETTDWTVYPNPATNIIWVDMEDVAPYTCEVLDAQGRVLLRQANLSGKRTLNIAQLSSGIYFVRILAGGQAFTPKKIIKL
jgi:hypothetical protein